MKVIFTLFILSISIHFFAQDLVLSDYQINTMFNNHSPSVINIDQMNKLIGSKSNLSIPSNIDQFTQKTSVAAEFGLGNALYVFSRAKSGKDADGLPDHRIKRRIALSIQSQATFESAYAISYKEDSITTVNQDYAVRGRHTLISGEYSKIYSTPFDKIITFYTGYGASFGFALASKFEETINTNRIIQTSAGQQSTFSPEVNKLNGKMNIALSAFVPAGLHIQAYKQFGILVEARLGANYIQSLGGVSYIKPVVMFGLGFRYSFGKYIEKMTEEEMLY